MQPKLVIADVFRSVARAVTVFLVPTIVVYSLFVGLQLASGEPGFLGLSLNILLLLLMSAGFVIAWRRESMGAAISFGALTAFIVLGLVLSGFRATFSSSPLVWPLSLLVALIKPQSFDPVPSWILVTSWALLAAPICLLLASWLMRRDPS
jgi:hypothetical protein